jgi:hypothetical protein
MIFGGRMAGGECQPLAFADVRWQGRNRPPGLVVAGRRVISAAQEGRPRQDSNLRTRLRRPLLYPLSYGGSGREKDYQYPA